MIFLPIVERELRVAARRRATHWVRAGFALGTIFIGVLVYLSNLNATARQFANNLFSSLAILSLFYCLVSGVRLTADCLSEEKREGTLGLLFLTDLKGYDVVLVKLLASSVPAFYGVLAVFPVLAITLTMGGVTAGEFWRMTLVFMNTLFFSLSVGMLVSSLSQQENRAMSGAAGMILLVSAGLPLVGLVLNLVGVPGRFTVALPSPLTAWRLAFDAWGTGFWFSLLSTHGLGWSFLIFASLLLPRLWRQREGMISRTTRPSPQADARLPEHATKRTELLEVHPVYWLNSRGNTWPWITWAAVVSAWAAATLVPAS